MVESIHVNEIAAQMRTKKEQHTFVRHSGGAAIPHDKHINSLYLTDIITGEQKFIPKSEFVSE